MNTRTGRADGVSDLGTLWVMQRQDHRARCALIVQSRHWALHVLVDGKLLIAERCERGANTFELAESFKQRLLADGWRLLVPRVDRQPGAPAA